MEPLPEIEGSDARGQPPYVSLNVLLFGAQLGPSGVLDVLPPHLDPWGQPLPLLVESVGEVGEAVDPRRHL